jgi:hypothetical protein
MWGGALGLPPAFRPARFFAEYGLFTTKHPRGLLPWRTYAIHTRNCQITGILKLGENMTTLTDRDIQRNMRAVAHAIGQQELEGLKVSESAVADLHRAARGEIGTDEVLRNIYRRVQHVSLLHR